MDDSKKVILAGVTFIVLLAIGVGVYYLVLDNKGKKTEPVEEVKTPADTTEEVPVVADKELEPLSLPAVKLDKSDDTVRGLAKQLSSHPQLVRWLTSRDLIRRFVAAVDNIANGQSPRGNIDFFTPDEKFTVIDENGLTFMDPASYDRYNVVSDVFDTLNTAECVRLYRGLKPLIQEAYRDLGYPQGDFDRTLAKAIDKLLKTPVVERSIELEKKVTTYMMVDSELENLEPAQKHLLRMGPENVQLIQLKLKEMAQALGFSGTGD